MRYDIEIIIEIIKPQNYQNQESDLNSKISQNSTQDFAHGLKFQQIQKQALNRSFAHGFERRTQNYTSLLVFEFLRRLEHFRKHFRKHRSHKRGGTSCDGYADFMAPAVVHPVCRLQNIFDKISLIRLLPFFKRYNVKWYRLISLLLILYINTCKIMYILLQINTFTEKNDFSVYSRKKHTESIRQQFSVKSPYYTEKMHAYLQDYGVSIVLPFKTGRTWPARWCTRQRSVQFPLV
ncbi:Hypothetical_protein [Hexamita inflata]|uniref:Hypothetical_protein n=1 Tax=Hexamita inflata TaxID=28002 RepID=A0ABP1J6H9_9EUKA